jgi:hypothetical protein
MAPYLNGTFQLGIFILGYCCVAVSVCYGLDTTAASTIVLHLHVSPVCMVSQLCILV